MLRAYLLHSWACLSADALIEVPKGGGFADMVALKGDKEIGDKINTIIAKLAEANDLKPYPAGAVGVAPSYAVGHAD